MVFLHFDSYIMIATLSFSITLVPTTLIPTILIKWRIWELMPHFLRQTGALCRVVRAEDLAPDAVFKLLR